MEISINDIEFKLRVSKTKDQIKRGMMGKSFDNSFNGMLFVMGNGEHCFWMKNCIINLDILFIENDVITKIYHNCSPCDDDCINYCGTGRYVLEIKGGTCKKLGIKVGDLVE